MPSTPPTELLEAIIDHVASSSEPGTLKNLLSVCRSCKALVPRTQMHIYSDVTLYPVSERYYRILGANDFPLCHSTLQLARTIEDRPDLGLHVRTLRCCISTALQPQDDHKLGQIISALKFMPNIHELIYGSGNPAKPLEPREPPFSFGRITSVRWTSAMSDLMQRPGLDRLILHNFKQYPLELLHLPSNVRRLTIAHTSVTAPGPTEGFQVPGAPTPVNHCVYRLPGVESIDATSILHPEDTSWSYLNLAQNLRRLRFIVSITIGVSDVGWANPLSRLHPGSLTSLTHIYIRVSRLLFCRGATIYHPFGCQWHSGLFMFSRIQTLQLELSFHGLLAVDGDSFGSQWGNLASSLDAGRDCCPDLREVYLSVEITVSGQGSYLERKREEAQVFLRNLNEAIDMYHLPVLRDLRREGHRVASSFRANTVGPPHAV